MIMYFYVFAAVVLLILAAFALYYSVLWQRRKREIHTHYQAQQQKIIESQSNCQTSIEILARGLLDDQVTLTEACIRISGLAQALPLSDEQLQALNVYHKVAEATSHIPILDEWQKLPAKKQKEFDKSRLHIEDQYREFVIPSAEKIVSGEFFNVSSKAP